MLEIWTKKRTILRAGVGGFLVLKTEEGRERIWVLRKIRESEQ